MTLIEIPPHNSPHLPHPTHHVALTRHRHHHSPDHGADYRHWCCDGRRCCCWCYTVQSHFGAAECRRWWGTCTNMMYNIVLVTTRSNRCSCVLCILFCRSLLVPLCPWSASHFLRKTCLREMRYQIESREAPSTRRARSSMCTSM